MGAEDLKLRMRNIDVRAERGGHSKWLAVLLGTLKLDRWWFSGWLERLILRSIEQIVTQEQVHKRILRWDELPIYIEWRRKLRQWREREKERRESRRHRLENAATVLQAVARGRAVRSRPLMITSQGKSLVDAISDFFQPSVPESGPRAHAQVSVPETIQLPNDKSLEDFAEEFFVEEEFLVPEGMVRGRGASKARAASTSDRALWGGGAEHVSVFR
eukprot:CAMPEP_0181258246 /NCGR_PEP_ID=MMETSP1096-20121128/50678_1 /TAXON_ID=156174 ORGANISM="Chrysochromulina ericina, Strain CCMP281" /NCGR_SAMPLE_ID=MMETSP1096 /ASSEMBLY_ACC=CAM_ASM_000453 /LENGTH=216 /DNA_ID=CAMNT_0023356623 /DNA_START=131 /DNA_END=781 /DNA_ORIENTATION=-